jgi:hypothetical protein
MKTETIRLLIIAFLVVQLFASMLVPAGQPRYRIRERIAAMEAYTLNPSATTKAAREDEFARLHHHERMQGIILGPLFLTFDAAVIYFFWNYGTRKTLA